MKTAAIIPAFNEANRVPHVLRRVVEFVDEVILVDDGSFDTTCTQASSLPGVHYVRHRVNCGKGAALKTGADYAIRRNCDILVFLDADGQHKPEEIPTILRPLHEREADICFGVRTLQADTSMPFIARLGNLFLTHATKILFGLCIADTQCGFRAMTREAYQKIRWESTSYAVETEMIVRAGKNHLRVRQVPITTIYHDRYKGTTIVDGVRIFLSMLFWKFH
jgi:glycosyltransferase involved in cell wall biosynthesis